MWRVNLKVQIVGVQRVAVEQRRCRRQRLDLLLQLGNLRLLGGPGSVGSEARRLGIDVVEVELGLGGWSDLQVQQRGVVAPAAGQHKQIQKEPIPLTRNQARALVNKRHPRRNDVRFVKWTRHWLAIR